MTSLATRDQPEGEPDAGEQLMFRVSGISFLHIPALDAHESARFYASVFGWKIVDHPEHPSFEDGTGHVIGAFVTDLPVAGDSGVLPYIYVDGVDAALRSVIEYGGAAVMAPYPEGDLWIATFRDPAGNVVGVWQRGPRTTRPALNIGLIALGVTDIPRAARFWGQALGYELYPGGFGGCATVLALPDGSGPRLALQRSESSPPQHPRLHLDLHVADAAEQAAEAARLVSLGAERVDWDDYPEDPDFVVLADPDGNRFCIVDLSHSQG
jgi:predicted enzyme related to lactoylglutathione lyase